MFTLQTSIKEFYAQIEIGDYSATIEAEGHDDDPSFNRFSLHYVGNTGESYDNRLHLADFPATIQKGEHTTMQTAVTAALAALKWAIRYDIDNLQDQIDALPAAIAAPDTPPAMPEADASGPDQAPGEEPGPSEIAAAIHDNNFEHAPEPYEPSPYDGTYSED